MEVRETNHGKKTDERKHEIRQPDGKSLRAGYLKNDTCFETIKY